MSLNHSSANQQDTADSALYEYTTSGTPFHNQPVSVNASTQEDGAFDISAIDEPASTPPHESMPSDHPSAFQPASNTPSTQDSMTSSFPSIYQPKQTADDTPADSFTANSESEHQDSAALVADPSLPVSSSITYEEATLAHLLLDFNSSESE